jgi:FkbM family methyltransferase
MKSLLISVISHFGEQLRHTPIANWSWLQYVHGKLAVGLGSADNIKVGEFLVFADPRDKVITKKLILYGEYERQEIAQLCAFIRPGDCVLDVGANIGLYTLAFSRAVGPQGHVIAVEPDPDNLLLLRKNLEVNNCVNVTVIEAALSDETKAAKLYQMQDNRGALSTADVFDVGEANAIRISNRRADEIYAQTGRVPRIAKIDVEGQEPLVIAGMATLLPEILQFEFVPEQLRAAGHDPLGCLRILEARGYALSVVAAATGEIRQLPLVQLVQEAEASVTDLNLLAQRGPDPRQIPEASAL